MVDAAPAGSHRNQRSATSSPSTPHAATRASLSHWNAGASTAGLKASWKLCTNGFSGRMSPSVASHAGGSSMAMKTSEMNAIGRMMALASAEAADADGQSPAIAMPIAANEETPTRNVTIAAGILAASMSRS